MIHVSLLKLFYVMTHMEKAEKIHDLLVQIGILASDLKLGAQEYDGNIVERIYWLATVINNGINAADDANWLLKKAIHEGKK